MSTVSTAREDPGVQIPGYLVAVSAATDTTLRDADPGDKSATIQIQGADDVRVRVITGNEIAADAGTVAGTRGFVLAGATAPSLAGEKMMITAKGKIVARALGASAIDVYIERVR